MNTLGITAEDFLTGSSKVNMPVNLSSGISDPSVCQVVAPEDMANESSRAKVMTQIKLRNARILKNYLGIPITGLKGKEQGKEIYVMGSGPSMDKIDPESLRDKITIGCNRIHKRFPCSYIVHIHQIFAEDIPKESIPVMSEHDAGYFLHLNNLDRSFYFFKHYSNHDHSIDYRSLDEDDKLVVGSSVIHSAIHLAHYLGASKIIILGHDCKSEGAKTHFNGYNDNLVMKWKLQTHYLAWEIDTTELVRRLIERGTQIDW